MKRFQTAAVVEELSSSSPSSLLTNNKHHKQKQGFFQHPSSRLRKKNKLASSIITIFVIHHLTASSSSSSYASFLGIPRGWSSSHDISNKRIMVRRPGNERVNGIHTTTRINADPKPSSSSSSSSLFYPNWRRQPRPPDESTTTTKSPFWHSSTTSSSSSEPSWSEDQFQQSLHLHTILSTCTDPNLSPFLQQSLSVLHNAYRLYGPHSVIGSYNGGKDAVVIMHLMRAAHAKYLSEECCLSHDYHHKPRPRVIYFELKDEFPQVESLLRRTVDEYDLDMIAFECGTSFVDGLRLLVRTNHPPSTESPHPMAFVLGTRSSDPNAGSQGTFAPSSDYMPPFMRVNPILDWSYGKVWQFLRRFDLPYCELYDQGYTSLGTVKDTFPCPALMKDDDDGKGGYWPAYMLEDYDQERAGRVKKDKKKKKKKDDNDKVTTTTTTTTLEKEKEVNQTEPSSTTTISKTIQSTTTTTTTNNNTTTTNNNTIKIALIIIGDEILKGLTPDINTHAAAKALRHSNVLQLAHVSIIPDTLSDVQHEIERLNNNNKYAENIDYIITSGGIGPTHDDITIQGVALGLNLKMVLDDRMVRLLREQQQQQQQQQHENDDDLTKAQKKMATLPETSELLFDNNNAWPTLFVKNVFIFPGVPKFFERKVKFISDFLSQDTQDDNNNKDNNNNNENEKRRSVSKIVLSVDETEIVSALDGVVERHPSVSIGSYPFFDDEISVKTVITLEGMRDKKNVSDLSMGFSFEEMDDNLNEAVDDLLKELPKGSVIRVDDDDDLTRVSVDN